TCWRDPVKGLTNIRRALKPDGIFVVNHPNVDGIVARWRGERYFELNHASMTIFSNNTFQDLLNRCGFETTFCHTERQYASIGRIVTYLKMGMAVKLCKSLGLDSWTIPVLALGTTFEVCRPSCRSAIGTEGRRYAA